MAWPARKFPDVEGPDVVRVNLCCGTDYREGWINTDCNPTGSLRVDVEFNLEDVPWPFADSSVDQVLLSNIVEHVRHGLLFGVARKTLRLLEDSLAGGRVDPAKVREIERLAGKDGLLVLLEEVHRILRPDGIVDIHTANTGTPETWLHPEHARGMEPDFWHYVSSEAPPTRRYYSTAKFRLVRQVFERTLNYRAPLRWLGVRDYHVQKYLGPLAPLVCALGVPAWHITRLAAVKPSPLVRVATSSAARQAAPSLGRGPRPVGSGVPVPGLSSRKRSRRDRGSRPGGAD